MKKYKLSNSVFYRKYGKHVPLFFTENKNAYIFNDASMCILEFFHDFASINDFLKSLIEFNLSGSEKAELIKFIENLVSEKILIEEYKLCESNDDALISFHRELLPKDQLYSVFFELTYRCNEKCKFCYCVVDDNNQELSTAEVKRVIDDLVKMNVFEVTFSGGDPFVRKDFFEILEYAREKELLINIFTNGLAISDDDIFRLKKLHIKSIHFSIYRHIPKKHDAFTQVVGSFDKTVSVIEKCILINLPVNIKTSILNYNIDEAREIIKLAESLGTTIQTGVSVSVKNNGDNTPKVFCLNNVDEYVKALKVIGQNIETECRTEYTASVTDNDSNYHICGAGRNILSINPYGEVFPCNSLMLSCGNVRNLSIKDIWDDADVLNRVRNFTMSMIKGCEKCDKQDVCGFCPGSAMMETGDPLMKYSEACMIAEAYKIYKSKEDK